MKRIAGVLAALAALSMAAQAHATQTRLVTAFAKPAFDKSTPVRISPISPEQARDPVFHQLAEQLVGVMQKNGFNIAKTAAKTDVIVFLEYMTYSVPHYTYGDSSVNDPSYRAVVITGVDGRMAPQVRVLWQTVVDSTGISRDVRAVVPGLMEAAGKHLASSKTVRGLNAAAWCADGVPITGSLMPPACSPDSIAPAGRYSAALAATAGQSFNPPGAP